MNDFLQICFNIIARVRQLNMPWSDEETDVLSLEQSCVGFSFEEAQEQAEKEVRYGKIKFLIPMRVVRQKQSILV